MGDDDLRSLPSVIRAVAIIDEHLLVYRTRTMAPSAEVVDLLLDLREALAIEFIPMTPVLVDEHGIPHIPNTRHPGEPT